MGRTKRLRHRLCHIILLTNLTKPRVMHNSALGNVLHILSVLDFVMPVAAKTWGRPEAAVPENLGESE
jgi:hypothetical protein